MFFFGLLLRYFEYNQGDRFLNNSVLVFSGRGGRRFLFLESVVFGILFFESCFLNLVSRNLVFWSSFLESIFRNPVFQKKNASSIQRTFISQPYLKKNLFVRLELRKYHLACFQLCPQHVTQTIRFKIRFVYCFKFVKRVFRWRNVFYQTFSNNWFFKKNVCENSGWTLF